jgi:hypothetical protein
MTPAGAPMRDLASIASGIASGKLSDYSVGNLPWIVNTRRYYDFDDFFGEDIQRGIVTINAEGAQREVESLVQPLNLFRLQLVFR